MSRILLLSHDLSSNGVWTTVQLSGALRRIGHEVTIAGPVTAGLWPALEKELRDAVQLSGRNPDSIGLGVARQLAEGADAIYAFKAIRSSFGLARRLRSETGRPVLLHLDDRDTAFLAGRGAWDRVKLNLRTLGQPAGPVALRAEERRIPDADALTVSTRGLQSVFGGTVVPQGLDESVSDGMGLSRAGARAELGLPAGEEFVLFTGTPTPHKGLHTLQDLIDAGIRVHIVGASASRLEEAGVPAELVRRFGVHGPVHFDLASRWIRASTLFVVPQIETPFTRFQLPAKILHAMTLGRAVVATSVGAIPDVLGTDDRAGRVVPAGDRTAFVAAVRELMKEDDLRTAAEDVARSRAVRSLCWTAMGRLLVPVLESVGIRDSDLSDGRA